jgi:hypothetical protein
VPRKHNFALKIPWAAMGNNHQMVSVQLNRPIPIHVLGQNTGTIKDLLKSVKLIDTSATSQDLLPKVRSATASPLKGCNPHRGT